MYSFVCTYSFLHNLYFKSKFVLDEIYCIVSILFIYSKLDYESIDSIGYRFKVIATDAGQPPKSSSAYVRVNVQNTNDEAPRFESTRLERIEATKAVDSVVTTVLASDPDGDKVSYQIVSSE